MWMWAGSIGFGTVAASLYDDPSVWIGVGVAFAITVGLTFLVPLLPGRRKFHDVGPGPYTDPDSDAPQTL